MAVVASVACVASVALFYGAHGAHGTHGLSERMGRTESLRIHSPRPHELPISALPSRRGNPREKSEEPLICNHSFLNKQLMVLLHR